jgi:hypothetical protein
MPLLAVTFFSAMRRIKTKIASGVGTRAFLGTNVASHIPKNQFLTLPSKNSVHLHFSFCLFAHLADVLTKSLLPAAQSGHFSTPNVSK